MSTDKFKDDLKLGQEAELQFAQLMTDLGYTVESTQDKGRFADYDVAAKNNGTIILFEIKKDRWAHATQNVVVEIAKRIDGEEMPSGISETKADFVVYQFYNDNNFYAIPTAQLKLQVAMKKYKHQLYGGDGQRSKLVMFDLKEFKNNCEIINKETMAN